MFSITLPRLIGPETPDAILAAVQTVAERSFFAVVEPCDDRSFSELAATVSRWLAATVKFEEGPVIGSMSCTLPEDLARDLVDAFCGRDPSDPAATRDQVLDLVGEFANMACGAWLSRCASEWTFKLSPPVVEPVLQPAGADLLRLFVVVNDRPLAVSVRLLPPAPEHSGAASAGA